MRQDITELETERLYLRTLTEADEGALREVFPGEFKTKEDALSQIRWILNNGYDGRTVINFYIWLGRDGPCIGRVYLHAKPEIGGEVEIGYGIGEAYRRKGYATEAAQAALRFAFEDYGQEVLAAIVKPENIASQCVIEKLGFSRRGTRVVPDENGVECVFDYFQLFCEEYRSANS